ncbi:SRPBCC family protein [Actinopolymorpha alba]|uniref:SRPBCC family protein n=1 Tax=Actinopolymorpha alba TaxID=533267 RepID=UPI0003612DDD|nr:SRPBCC family protein [Actinopolymorpha alba]
MNETLRTVDGRPVLRIERRLAHPPEKVWRALTEPAELSQWYPFRAIELDLRVGGTILFDDGQGTTMDAVITELDPPRSFAFSERAPAEMTRESDDIVQFELHPDGGGCLLVFSHTFDDRPAAASYAAGWVGCLDALRMVLDGEDVKLPDDSVERHERFIAKFGLGVGTTETGPDGWQVRFERQLMRQPIEHVWAALNAAFDVPNSEMSAPVVGGPVPRGFTTAQVPAGTVTAVSAPTMVEYAWLAGDEPAGRVRWELSTGPGGARIILTQSGPAGYDAQRAIALAAWQDQLAVLVKRLLEAT